MVGRATPFVAPAREAGILVPRAEERVRYGRSGVCAVSVRRGDDVIAEFRGRSRGIGSTRPEESA